ncbi:hypothetical protein M413DRAFT_287424 [Hebeloma cylindrosporum]|uniref:Uncharacterized protein n=1 Tax=Hebeloma cylindrosporum TaxID=76867 RepID=A0A0C2XFL6_HEBCY|nr:hypothetical protein M413DRAFT_287424 [Hebeloma cylindrosporum h7]
MIDGGALRIDGLGDYSTPVPTMKSKDLELFLDNVLDFYDGLIRILHAPANFFFCSIGIWWEFSRRRGSTQLPPRQGFAFHGLEAGKASLTQISLAGACTHFVESCLGQLYN